MQNKLAVQFGEDRDLIMYWDFHGHSRKKNVFIYGNSTPEIQQEVKLFPFILSKIWSSFSYGCSKFKVQRHKESTARVAMWRLLNTNNVFTIEASFCGPNIGEVKDYHFRSIDYKLIGLNFWQAILIYAKIECPSLENYWNIKLEEEESENEKVEKTANSQLSTSKKQRESGKTSGLKKENAKSQPPSMYRHSNIIFHYQSSNGIEDKENEKIKSKSKNPMRGVNGWDYYDSYDVIYHNNIPSHHNVKPNLKIRKNEDKYSESHATTHNNLSYQASVLRSLDTAVILDEFHNKNNDKKEEIDSDESESGYTTSGSESNFDEKELAKILPAGKKWK